MAFRDNERRAALRAKLAQERLERRCLNHPMAYANGSCDGCGCPMCGACLLKPIHGGTYCPSCVSVSRARWRRTRVSLIACLIILALAVTVGALAALTPECKKPLPGAKILGYEFAKDLDCY